MPKKTAGVNTKVAAANDRKAAAQKEKDKKKSEDAEQRDAADWAGGAKGKSKKDAEADKKVSERKPDLGDQTNENHLLIQTPFVGCSCSKEGWSC